MRIPGRNLRIALIVSGDFGCLELNRRDVARGDVYVASVFIGALIFLFALQQPYTLLMGLFLSALYFFWSGAPKTVNLIALLIMMLVVIVVLVPSIFFRHGLSPLFYICSTALVAGAAIGFSKLPLARSLQSLLVVFWFFWGLTLCLWWWYRASVEPLGEIIPGSSTNGIPSYFIVLQVAVSVTFLLYRARLPILTPIATLCVAFLGLGRGSIVVAIALLAVSFIFNCLFFYGRTLLARVGFCLFYFWRRFFWWLVFICWATCSPLS